jgi:hypothetical protein
MRNKMFLKISYFTSDFTQHMGIFSPQGIFIMI